MALEYYSRKEILQYAITWMDLQDILLGEKSGHKGTHTE